MMLSKRVLLSIHVQFNLPRWIGDEEVCAVPSSS